MRHGNRLVRKKGYNMAENQAVREAVGIFDAYDPMEKAIEELQISGFGRHQISVLGTEAAVRKRFGEKHVKTELLVDHPDAPRSPDIKKEELGIAQGVLVGGGILTGVVAAVIASGGLAVPGIVTAAAIGGAGGTAGGGVLAKLLGDKYGEFFQNQIDQGGLLLWVNTPDKEAEAKAQAILKKYGAKDVHVHELPVEDGQEDDSTHPPQLFGEAFVKLDQMAEAHDTLINEDAMLSNKIDDMLESLKNTAAKGDAVTQQQAQDIAEKINDTASYAKDMAEEEQRLVAEASAQGSGKQEKESECYFKLARDLHELEADYRRSVIRVISA